MTIRSDRETTAPAQARSDLDAALGRARDLRSRAFHAAAGKLLAAARHSVSLSRHALIRPPAAPCAKC